MFVYQQVRGDVEVAFTDRHGGVSAGPYASLNLAQKGHDDAVAVTENVRLAVEAFTGATRWADGDGPGPALARMHQVHGGDVTVVDRARAKAGDIPESDGLVTADPGTVLMVRVADCVPVLLADVESRVVGAAHAGRPGLVAGVVPTTVTKMRELGARHLVAWVGPHVCGRCYEVPHAMRAEVSAVVPDAYAETSWGTPAIDVGAGVRAQLRTAGVEVIDASRCTLEDEDLYSYRRQGEQAGRLAGLVWVRS